ncbi:MAG: immunoglobulin domain-containing protein, partial [Lachnospiraceae bacterium]|nr:immunoglobulin domain-containing protein [Lachnospiraceae bacterium]
QMGVEAVAEAQDALISYKWYHDGKVLENQNEKDLTLENVSSDDFGTYVCLVELKDDNDTEDTADDTVLKSETLDFTLSEQFDVSVLTPNTSYIYGKGIGDEVNLKVEVENKSSENVDYQWYKIWDYYKSRYYNDYGSITEKDSYEKIDGADKPEYTFTINDEYDYGMYVCFVSSGRMKEEVSVFVENDNYGNYADIDGTGMQTKYIYKKVGDNVDFKVNAVVSDGVTVKYEWTTKELDSYDTTRKIDKETTNVLSLKDLKESQFNRVYQCEVTFYKDDEQIGKEIYISFNLKEETDNETAEYDCIREYGTESTGGYNQIGDKVRFGIETDNEYTYKWKFAREYYDENGGSECYGDYPGLLSENKPVISYDAIKEEQFGKYYLYIYSEDEDGSKVLLGTEDFYLRLYNDSVIDATTLNGESEVTIKRSVGDSAKFEVVSNIDDKNGVTYQWYKANNSYGDSGALNGENSNVLNIDNITSYDFGTYVCNVTYQGTVEKVTFYLVRTGNLKVESDLFEDSENGQYTWNYYLEYGKDITFNVKATSDEEYPIEYQWYYNDDLSSSSLGKKLDNKTASLTVSDFQKDKAGVYSCNVSNGIDGDTIVCRYILSAKNDKFLYFYQDTTGEDANDSAIYYNEGRIKQDNLTAAYNESIIMDATAVASEGEDIVYEWYKFDDIQKRYILIDGETSATFTTTPYTDENYTDDIQYKCIVKTSYDEIQYSATVSVVDNIEIESSADEYGFVMEGTEVTFTAKLRKEDKDFTYQWYAYDENGNLCKVEGATSSVIKVEAPKVQRVDPENKYKVQAYSTETKYICEVQKGAEDTYVRYYQQVSLISVLKPDTYTELPKSLYSDGVNVQAINIPDAQTIHLEFSDEYELGGLYSTLFIIKENGEVIRYPNAEKEDVAGEILDIEGSTVYLYYIPLFDSYSSVLDTIKIASKNKHGYEVVCAKD